jgi:hypothetical protein
MENLGAGTPNLNLFKAKFNPHLSILELNRRDARGKAAEWVYATILNRNWMKKKVVSYLE